MTPAEEAAGLAALAAARLALDGALLVVELPHGRTATVMDPLAVVEDTAPGDVLVLSPGGPHFFGRGNAVASLDAAFPGGWRGGELPRRGFWGVRRRIAEEALLGVLAKPLALPAG